MGEGGERVCGIVGAGRMGTDGQARQGREGGEEGRSRRAVGMGGGGAVRGEEVQGI